MVDILLKNYSCETENALPNTFLILLVFSNGRNDQESVPSVSKIDFLKMHVCIFSMCMSFDMYIGLPGVVSFFISAICCMRVAIYISYHPQLSRTLVCLERPYKLNFTFDTLIIFRIFMFLMLWATQFNILGGTG